jgi:hypothetical protein
MPSADRKQRRRRGAIHPQGARKGGLNHGERTERKGRSPLGPSWPPP